MIVIQFLQVTQNNLIIALDNQHNLIIWDLGVILKEHNTRIDEKNQNAFVYKFQSQHSFLYNNVKALLHHQNNLLLIIQNKVYAIEIQKLYSQLQSDDNNFLNNVLSFKNEITSTSIYQNLLIGVNNILYIIDQHNDYQIMAQIDITSTINENIISLIPITNIIITDSVQLEQQQVAIGTNLGFIGIWCFKNNNNPQLKQIVRFKDRQRHLHEVQQLIYICEIQYLISLHDNGIVFWNLILAEDVFIVEGEQYTSITYQNGIIYATTDNKNIELFEWNGKKLNNILTTSSEINLQMIPFKIDNDEYLICNGSTPFADLYKNKSYTLTLTCI